MLIEGDVDIEWNDKQKYYDLLDTYFTRRMLCGMTSKNYNKVVLDFIKFEPPRLYRRVIYLSQAAMPDRVKLS